jgi:hypothetical protein
MKSCERENIFKAEFLKISTTFIKCIEITIMVLIEKVSLAFEIDDSYINYTYIGHFTSKNFNNNM